MTSRPDAPALVIGADGLLGRALADRLAATGALPWETTRRERAAGARRVVLDLAGEVADWEPPGTFSVAYLCAAVSALRDCRDDPEGTARVNVRSTLALASTLVRLGGFVVFPSTSLVFDGEAPFREPEEPVSPRTEYGRQKAMAERGLLALDSCAVVRLTKVVGPRPSLLEDWGARLRRGEAIHPLRDKVMAPLDVAFAVEALVRVGEARLSGITQVSASRDLSYEEVAQALCRRLEAAPALVRGRTSLEAGLDPNDSPPHTTLCTSRLTNRLGLAPPDPWTTLEGVLDR